MYENGKPHFGRRARRRSPPASGTIPIAGLFLRQPRRAASSSLWASSWSRRSAREPSPWKTERRLASWLAAGARAAGRVRLAVAARLLAGARRLDDILHACARGTASLSARLAWGLRTNAAALPPAARAMVHRASDVWAHAPWPALAHDLSHPQLPRLRVPRTRTLVIVGSLLTIGWIEARTSILQARVFSTIASMMSYRVVSGPSGDIVYPPTRGPFDRRTGYARLPEFDRRLAARGFRMVEQSSFSPTLISLARSGITPPFREPEGRGLVIAGLANDTLFDETPNDRLIRRYDEIPPLIVNTLLHLEDRDLRETSMHSSNPSVDWPRFSKAMMLYVAHKLGFPVRVEGGSTLAVQMEKYLHADEGLTSSPTDKLRQMFSASLKAYRRGIDTRMRRREIVLDYLNTIPLAAAPRYGEVTGLKDGLHHWFGLEPRKVFAALREPGHGEAKASAYKHVLALLYSVRAPSEFLIRDRATLDARVHTMASALTQAGVIDPVFARQVDQAPLRWATPRREHVVPFAERKAPSMVRRELQRLLGARDFYELDRLDLKVETTLDVKLQGDVSRLFKQLGSPEFVAQHGLVGEHMLNDADPGRVIYSMVLYERSPEGNLLRAYVDNLDRPFDVNTSTKLELGSTAKLRTLVHYLEVMAGLRTTLAALPSDSLETIARDARDPLTAWSAQLLSAEPDIAAEAFLDSAMERRYSASPYETFLTGGGLHHFVNFDANDNDRRPTVREGTIRSTNLVYIRLMRDLVRYHEARLPYDADEVMNDLDSPLRKKLLEGVVDQESRLVVARAYRAFHDQSPDAIVERLLGPRAQSPRDLALLFYAWHPEATRDDMLAWLKPRTGEESSLLGAALADAQRDSAWTLEDYGWLLGIEPVEIWCAQRMAENPAMSLARLSKESAEVRQNSMAWLMSPKRVKAQNQRLHIRLERDAFALMTPAWRRLGFPFERLVPSLATAIGSSADRPAALATLMGILVNDGVRRSDRVVQRLAFGTGTPYHTVFEAEVQDSERVLAPEIAKITRRVLAQVVEQGTARRVSGTIRGPDSSAVVIGGKTGSGDNRFETFDRDGQVLTSRAINRTAVFTFYFGERHFGVITAMVIGPQADQYEFTSSLPLAVMDLLAEPLEQHLAARATAEATPTAGTTTAPSAAMTSGASAVSRLGTAPSTTLDPTAANNTNLRQGRRGASSTMAAYVPAGPNLAPRRVKTGAGPDNSR